MISPQRQTQPHNSRLAHGSKNSISSPTESLMRPTLTQRAILVAGSLLLTFALNNAYGDTQTFSVNSAVLDKEIPESVREAFEDGDGKPMKSVSVDLNNDKNPEKIIPNEFLCGNGGCPWVVYSPKLNRVIGRLFANAIVILDATTEGYKQIRTSWNFGVDKTGTALYTFRNGTYVKEK